MDQARNTIPPPVIGTEQPVFSDFYLSWVYVIGTAFIVLFILLIFVFVFIMKTCGRDTDWMDIDVRTGLFTKIRIGTIIAVVLVSGVSAAVIGERMKCNNFSILGATSLVFQECNDPACSTVQSCSSCSSKCCVTYDPISLTVFSFCEKDLQIWFVMIVPIGICIVAVGLVFVSTRKSQFM